MRVSGATNTPMCCDGTTSEIRTPEGPHWAKLVCAVCGRFQKWLPKPESERIKKWYDSSISTSRVSHCNKCKRPILWYMDENNWMPLDVSSADHRDGKTWMESHFILCPKR